MTSGETAKFRSIAKSLQNKIIRFTDTLQQRTEALGKTSGSGETLLVLALQRAPARLLQAIETDINHNS